MIVSLISFLIALAFRLLMGYLATKYSVLNGWFMWVINAFVIVLGIVVAAFVIRKLYDAFSGIGRKNKKKNKKSEEDYEKDKGEK